MRTMLPIGVSVNGRHFTGADGRPFFWLGDTQWNLWRCHSRDEAALILDNRAARGFTVIQVMLTGFGFGLEADPVFGVSAPTPHGEAYPERDVGAPNREYFRHVDAVVERAERLGLVLAVGLDHPRLLLATPSSARGWGRWVGERFRARGNIIWIPSYTIPEGEHLAVTRLLAQGLRDGAGAGPLMTCHPDPADPYCTSGVAHAEPWLDFNSIQTWKRYDCIQESVRNDRARLPPKPVVMAEGAYEDGPEYGFPVTARLVRMQAYWTYLSGGHHSYGHNDNWRVLPSWRKSLDAPGASHMGLCRRILERLSWWHLVPDQSILRSDPGSGSGLVTAARSARGEWIAVYLPERTPVSVRTAGLLNGRSFSATWTDPRTGEEGGAGEHAVSAGFDGRTPDELEDGLLVLRAATGA